jgi:8-oxo-dGTP diphosphatase
VHRGTVVEVTPGVQVVVGAAIVRDGRTLAARRRAPSHLAGGWEFPGGKVESGEPDGAALVRECREELGVEILVGELLGRAQLAPGVELRLYLAKLIRGEPRALEDHDALRWLTAAELNDVPWLPGDRPVLPALRERL